MAAAEFVVSKNKHVLAGLGSQKQRDWPIHCYGAMTINPQTNKIHFPHPTMSSYESQQETLKDKTLVCDSHISGNTCGYVAVSDGDLDRHQMSVHAKRRITPPHKYWGQMQKEDKRSVFAEANKDKILPRHLPCPYKDKTGCPYIGPRKHHLDNHIKIHLPEEEKKNLECGRCGRKFADQSNLRRHQKQIHDKLLKWRCDKCIRPYASAIKRDWVRHCKTKIHKSTVQKEVLDFGTRSNIPRRKIVKDLSKTPSVNDKRSYSSNGDKLAHVLDSGGSAKYRGDSDPDIAEDPLGGFDDPIHRTLKKEYDDYSDSKVDAKKFDHVNNCGGGERAKNRASLGEQIKRKLSKSFATYGTPTSSSNHEHNSKSNELVQTRRRCVLCPTLTESEDQMNVHVLDHFRKHLLSSLTTHKPYLCPECGVHKWDMTTLLWHYAFGHKRILKYCNEYVLRGQPISTG